METKKRALGRGLEQLFNSDNLDLQTIEKQIYETATNEEVIELTIDDTGLKYRFEAPNTALGDELLEGLRRGDISTSSFAFTIGKDTWTKKEDGSYLRTINSFKELFDVSPVYKEAYPDTSVALRKMQDLESEDLKDYFAGLRNKVA